MTSEAKARDNPLRSLVPGKTTRLWGNRGVAMSSSTQASNAESRRPLQFSLRFAMGVLTAFAVLCAAAKTLGEAFWAVVTLMLFTSSFLAASLAVLCVVAFPVVAVFPDNSDRKRKNLRYIYFVFVASIAWCFGPWVLVVMVLALLHALGAIA